MKIQSVSLSGFQCFSQERVKIDFSDLTCFVGPNASGKTAAMIGLTRMFGETQFQRSVLFSDFFLNVGENIEDVKERSLFIECDISFPELAKEEKKATSTIPEVFNQMLVDQVDGDPFCRIRLIANWASDGTPEGNVEQSISWVLSDSGEDEVETLHQMQAGDRGKIRISYIPAMRNPSQQIRSATTSSYGRLLKGIDWGSSQESISDDLNTLQNSVSQMDGIGTLSSQVQASWNQLYDGNSMQNVEFKASVAEPAAILKHLIPTFDSSSGDRAITPDDLSDGLRSLFYLSLSLGLFQVEELVRSESDSGFKKEIVDSLPILTLFAVEEPENHLSPHYLGRIISELTILSESLRAQVLISSHSTSILSRIEPDHVRYFLGHEYAASTRVLPIPLPSDDSEMEYTYVREAVLGFPELYFSRLIILGEGASEELVIRRLLHSSGTPLDSHYISVVPLGGRHVNHFWRLLGGLNIPFITLLDLDREKHGAGWGRIQYVRDQLVIIYEDAPEKLKFTNTQGVLCNLADEEFDKLSKFKDTDIESMTGWIGLFENQFDVFFSTPLDLDFTMLESFESEYKGLAPDAGGPRIPDSTQDIEKYNEVLSLRVQQVLSSETEQPVGSTYNDAQRELFCWYKYLFIDDSKPVTHRRALSTISDDDLRDKCPDVLKRLKDRVQKLAAKSPIPKVS